MMYDDAQVNVSKSRSPNITEEAIFTKSIARIACYNADSTPRNIDKYPRIIVAAGDDLKKFRRGVVRISIQDGANQRERHYFVNMDVMNSVFMRTYGAGQQ